MSEKNLKNKMVTMGVMAIVLMCALYYIGYQMGKGSATSHQYGTAAGMTGGAGRMRGGMGAGAVTGSVLSKDATSMTIQSRDGSSKIVLYSDSTQVMKSTAGTANDVTVGSQITVIGKTNSDGSVTAQSVQIRPNMPAPTTQPGATPAQ